MVSLMQDGTFIKLKKLYSMKKGTLTINSLFENDPSRAEKYTWASTLFLEFFYAGYIFRGVTVTK